MSKCPISIDGECSQLSDHSFTETAEPPLVTVARLDKLDNKKHDGAGSG